jgi:glycosyltransferase involved in cell wall biosynthesis
MVRVSVIIPVYNEERTIIQILERVAEQSIDGIEFERVVIDDGSKDHTVNFLEENPHLFEKLIKQPKNQGKGAAVKAGLEHASGEYILFQDADLEYDPTDYKKLLAPVLRFQADIVIGSRFVAPEFTRVFNFWHKIGNNVISFLFNLLNNTTFTDIYSCYLVYKRSLVDPQELRSSGWEQHAEILSLAVARGTQLYEVPISYFGRSYDEGKKIRGHHTVAVIWMILRKRLTR